MNSSSDYETKLLWHLSYPSKSWFTRRASLGGVLFVAGLIVALASRPSAQGTAGWLVLICADTYLLYLLQMGYVRAKKSCTT